MRADEYRLAEVLRPALQGPATNTADVNLQHDEERQVKTRSCLMLCFGNLVQALHQVLYVRPVLHQQTVGLKQ
jgi:hypothetical protein